MNDTEIKKKTVLPELPDLRALPLDKRVDALEDCYRRLIKELSHVMMKERI